MVIAGGTDAGITEAVFAGLSNMGPLSESNDDPAGASRPFDSDRDGFVFGEGAVVLVIESAEHAAARGARAYGSIAGGALTSDAFHMSAPEPSGDYAARRDPPRPRARRHRARRARLHLRPRHRDPRQRHLREPRDPRPLGDATDHSRQLAQVDGRPPDRRRRRPRRRWSACSRCATASSPRRSTSPTRTPSATSTTSPSPPARPTPDRRDRQRLRLRRPELRRRLPPLARARRVRTSSRYPELTASALGVRRLAPGGLSECGPTHDRRRCEGVVTTRRSRHSSPSR